MENIIVNIPGGIFKIPKECPDCGNDRTSAYFFQGRSFSQGSVPIYCDEWKCNCGHLDSYRWVAENGERLPGNTKTTLQLQEAITG